MATPKFKMFEVGDANGASGKLETEINKWVATLPPGAKVKRTQLAANEHRLYAMVNYDLDEAR